MNTSLIINSQNYRDDSISKISVMKRSRPRIEILVMTGNFKLVLSNNTVYILQKR